MNKKKCTFAILGILVALVLSACAKEEEPVISSEAPLNAPVITSPVIAEGTVVPSQDAVLAFESGGSVASILVEQGEWVEKGETLVRLDNQAQVEAELKTVELELLTVNQALADLQQNESLEREQSWQELLNAQLLFNAAQEAYDALDEDAFQDDLENAEEDVIDAQQDVEDAAADLEEYHDLDEENATRIRYEDALKDAQDDLNAAVRRKSEIQVDHDEVVNTYQKALAVLTVAQSEYDKRSEGPDVDALAQLEARVDSLETRKVALQEQLAKMTLKAPFSGQVVKIYPQESEFTSPGQPVVVLADTRQWFVETNDVTELEIVRIGEDQTVTIEVESFAGEIFSGTVESVGDFPNKDQGDVLYTVRIKLDDADLPALKWGMSVTITFQEQE